MAPILVSTPLVGPYIPCNPAASTAKEGSMAKRKPTDTAQMNLRLPETLRKKIEVEAKKNGWSLNRELVRRLEQSFTHQGFEDLIQSTIQSTAQKVVMMVDMRFS